MPSGVSNSQNNELWILGKVSKTPRGGGSFKASVCEFCNYRDADASKNESDFS